MDDPPEQRLVITDRPGKQLSAKPGEYDVMAEHIARCPIYADVRQLGCFGDARVLLDIAEVPKPGRRPLLRVRYAEGASSLAKAAV